MASGDAYRVVEHVFVGTRCCVADIDQLDDADDDGGAFAVGE